MKISTTHQKFADLLVKPEALQHPENFLGPNYLAVINFWLYLDTLNQAQWETVRGRYSAARDAAWGAARYAAWFVAENAARDAAGAATGAAAGLAAAWNAARDATYELIGSHILLEQGKSLFFLPMFDFTKEEGIDFSEIRPKTIMISTPTTSDFFPSYPSGSCQLLSVPDTTRHIFPIRNLCLEIEMPQE